MKGTYGEKEDFGDIEEMGKRIGWEYEKYLTLSFFSMKAKLLQSLYDFRLDVTEKYLGDEIILFNVQSPIDSLWTAAME